MALAARCPECNTAFRIVPDQLKISEGWVRCGHCSCVFNAFESQFEISEAALEQTLQEQLAILNANASTFAQSQSFEAPSAPEQNQQADEDDAQTVDLEDDTFENTAFEDTILQDNDEFELPDISPSLSLSPGDEAHDAETGFDFNDTLLSEFHIGWQDSFNQSPQPSHKPDKQPKPLASACSTFDDSSLIAETVTPEHTAWDASLNYDQLFASSWQDNNDLHVTIGAQNEIPDAASFNTSVEEVALNDPDTLQPAQQETHQPSSLHKTDKEPFQDDGLEVSTNSQFTSTAFFPTAQETGSSQHIESSHPNGNSVPKKLDFAPNDLHADADANGLTLAPLAYTGKENAPSTSTKNDTSATHKDAENMVESRFGNTAFSLTDFIEFADEMPTRRDLANKATPSDIPTPPANENNAVETSSTLISTRHESNSPDTENTVLASTTSKYNNTHNKPTRKKTSSKRHHASSKRHGRSFATNLQTDEDMQEVTFAKEKKPFAFWNKPVVKLSQYLIFFALSAILLAQLCLIYKDTLAAQLPTLRPALMRLCEPFACTVSYPRKISDITIYDSSFRRTNSTDPNRYTFMLLLKNTGMQTLEFPWVELTLIDNATATPYSRKIFSPQELGIQTTAFSAGKEAQINTQFTILTDEHTSLGFNIALFYP